MAPDERADDIDSDSMRAGLALGEFFVEYLPTVSLTDGRCVGAEALVRWRRPSGLVPPDRFIPAAENTPLSGLITYFVLDTVAAELGDWLRANPKTSLAVNVPPEILGRGGMEYAASKSGLLELSSQLILEITERGVPDSMGVEALQNAWGTGVRVALDDVTLAGGPNLAILARCPFQMLKLDRSLIAQIDGPDRPAPQWLAGLSALMLTSSLVVVAEGVETAEQVRVLRAAGVPAAQGFYFSRPRSAESLIAYHRATQGG